MTRLIFAAIAAVLIFQWTETPRTPTDSRAYLHAAQAFASGHDDPAFTQWPPGLPIVLAAFQLAGINPLHGMRWLNAACYALTVYLTLGQVTRWRVALGVALLMPFMWHIYLFVLSDAPFVLLTVLTLLQLTGKCIQTTDKGK